MKKEEYLQEVARIKEDIKLKNEYLQALTSKYIHTNRPFNEGEIVKITRKSGRITIGAVKGYGILQDRNVYVTAIKPEKGNNVYVSEPYLKIEKL